MSNHSHLSYSAALVLKALDRGSVYGFEIMQATGLASGTVYPILRRLESGGFVTSRWEDEEAAHSDGRPARRNYEATPKGLQELHLARERIAAQQDLLFGNVRPRKS